MSKQLAHHVIRTLESEHHSAYMVGGCVRDRLLGVEPKDWDICTSARPEQVMRIWPGAQLVGAKFGVCLVHYGDECVEVATYRSEGGYSDGRHPDRVQFETSALDDVLRRDFTINGLLMDLDGRVVDYVGGLSDLHSRCIRAIKNPRVRFMEDYLRMLRAVRFAGQLEGFRVEADTRTALVFCAHHITEISAERIAGELNKMLLGRRPAVCFTLLMNTGLLKEIYPSFEYLFGCEQPPDYHPEGDVWTHTVAALALLKQPRSLGLSLAVLFHDLGKPNTQVVTSRIQFPGHESWSADYVTEFCNRYRYSNEDRDRAVWLVAQHMRIGRMAEMRRAKQMQLMQSPYFGDLLELHRIDCESADGRMASYSYARNVFDNTPVEAVKPKSLLDGHAVMELLHIGPGKTVGSVLSCIQDAQLEGTITTVEQARDLALELGARFSAQS